MLHMDFFFCHNNCCKFFFFFVRVANYLSVGSRRTTVKSNQNGNHFWIPLSQCCEKMAILSLSRQFEPHSTMLWAVSTCCVCASAVWNIPEDFFLMLTCHQGCLTVSNCGWQTPACKTGHTCSSNPHKSKDVRRKNTKMEKRVKKHRRHETESRESTQTHETRGKKVWNEQNEHSSGIKIVSKSVLRFSVRRTTNDRKRLTKKRPHVFSQGRFAKARNGARTDCRASPICYKTLNSILVQLHLHQTRCGLYFQR